MGEPILIPLKSKYLGPPRAPGSQRGGHNRSGTKKRSKLDARRKALLPEQPKMVLLVNAKMKRRMVRVDE